MPEMAVEGAQVLEKERQALIRKLVQERSIMSVTELVELLGVSEATVRRDINFLAEREELRRIRGGAEALHPRHQAHLVGLPFAMSQGINADEKRAIARAAANLIQPGESIIINGGTTTFGLVEFLTAHELDILTNSFPIAGSLLSHSRNRVTVPGGTLYREQNIILSPFGNDTIDYFWGNKLFTGCFGLNRFGMMEADPLIVQAEVKLLQQADELVVLADSSKLRRQSSMIVARLDRISTVVTDSGARAEDLDVLTAAGVKVVVAQVSDEDRLAKSA